MTYLEELELAYCSTWQVYRYNHSGSRAGPSTAVAYRDLCQESFSILRALDSEGYPSSLVGDCLPKFYSSHSHVFSQHYKLGRSRLKQRHLSGNMSLSAGLGPAFRILYFANRMKLFPASIRSLIKVMLIHDLHKYVEKRSKNSGDNDKIGPQRSVAMACDMGVQMDECETWLTLNHDLHADQLALPHLSKVEWFRYLCLVKLADRCDKFVAKSLEESSKNVPASIANDRRYRPDNRLTWFFEKAAELANPVGRAMDLLCLLGITNEVLTLSSDCCHLWESPRHYLYMLMSDIEAH